MRVLIVSHHALPHVGGVEVLVDTEIRALAAAGHSVVLITSDGEGNAQTPVYPSTVRVLRIPAWHGLERRYRLPYPLFSPRLLPILWKEIGHSDVVHVHGSLFVNSVLALVMAWLRDRTRILTDHGGIQRFKSRPVSLLARIGVETVGRLSARLSTRLVSYNTRITQLLERLVGGRQKALFLPNPVDCTLFHPPTPEQRRSARERLGWEPGRPKVLFVGRLTAEKGVPLLLEASDPSYDSVFCGPGDPSILGRLPRDGVQYLPPRPQRDLVDLYHAADVLALPSDLREGFPLVVQEALACGLNAILSYDEGYEPYRRLPGLSFCERDPRALREAILRSLQSATSERTNNHFLELNELCPPPDVWLDRLYGFESLPRS